MTVFDCSTIARVADDTGSTSFARGLLRSYDDLLDRRVPRVVEATAAGDRDVALDAVLSLKVSSSTVGALELAELADVVARDLRTGDAAAAVAHARLLPAAALRVRAALTAALDDLPTGEPPVAQVGVGSIR